MRISIAPGRGSRISDKLYGIFLEDINYACDGGLYAELVPNRAFTCVSPTGEDHRLMRWQSVGGAALSVRTENPRGEKNPHYLQMTGAGEEWGVRSEGYQGEGFYAQRKRTYVLTLIARAAAPCQLMCRFVTEAGAVLAEGSAMLDADFRKHRVEFTVPTGARCYLTLVAEECANTVDLDFVSLFPLLTFHKRENGCRFDIAHALAEMKPSFLRFPGGCIVEGRSFANMYRFRDTLGPVEERPTNWNRWQLEEYQRDGIHSPDYYQSYGMGFYEFFCLCEDLGARPLPILNCGLTCQWHEGLTVPLDEMDGIVQDYFDLIEFANGAADTPMGRIRAEMGHPAPFGLTMIGVGNEQWQQVYFERYELIHRAVKARHPEIELIGCAGWTDHGEDFDAAMAWMRRTETRPDYSDEHYYKHPGWFYEQVNRYRGYDPALPAVFAGEYAAHEEDRRNTLGAALAEAAFLTGLENASPNVSMACYAPLLGRRGAYQWRPDLIWFDEKSVLLTPSYHVQRMFSTLRGDYLAQLHTQGESDPPLYLTASWRERDGMLILKAVNPNACAVTADIDLPAPASCAIAQLLTGDPQEDNTFDAPARISPVFREKKFSGASLKWTFEENSVTVLCIK